MAKTIGWLLALFLSFSVVGFAHYPADVGFARLAHASDSKTARTEPASTVLEEGQDKIFAEESDRSIGDLNHFDGFVDAGGTKSMVTISQELLYLLIAIMAMISVFMLLLLFRLSGIRNSIGGSERDIKLTKEALRHILDLLERETATESKAEKRQGLPEQTSLDISLTKIALSIEKVLRKVESLSANTIIRDAPSESLELEKAVDHRLRAMKIELIVPEAGENFDGMLHEEVDTRLSEAKAEGTIFRVIQNGLIYNNRVALKARVVVNKA